MRLTEFLLARIAEDEAEARAELPNVVDSDFLLKWQPRRVLAELAVKQRVVRLYAPGDKWDDVRLMKEMAAVYADHPDYDEEWKP